MLGCAVPATGAALQRHYFDGIFRAGKSSVGGSSQMSGVIDLIEATVKIEQPLGDGRATVGTGFVVVATSDDGRPRTILVSAAHVFADMKRDRVTVGFRERDRNGAWRYDPISVRIRDANARPLWTSHPTQDVAALEIPAGLAHAAVPMAEIPGEQALSSLGVQPGDEMMVLGYPRGVAANQAGFPILRSGRVASFPLSPADRYPTYMLDFSVFGGNSGGPVYLVLPPRGPGRAGGRVVITGVLTQQIKVSGDRLAIGNVTQADFISETVSLMANIGPTSVSPGSGSPLTSDPQKSAQAPTPTQMSRLKAAWRALGEDLRILVKRASIVVRDRVLDWLTPPPRRTPANAGRS